MDTHLYPHNSKELAHKRTQLTPGISAAFKAFGAKRTRSLLNRNFYSGHINFFVQALLDFFGRGVFKK